MERPGAWDDFMGLGQIHGDCLEISRANFDVVMKRRFQGLALGTLLHQVLEPVAAIMGWQDCGSCAEREMRLNGI
jgi:hypothetical protein